MWWPIPMLVHWYISVFRRSRKRRRKGSGRGGRRDGGVSGGRGDDGYMSFLITSQNSQNPITGGRPIQNHILS